MLDYTDEQRMIRDMVSKLAKEKIEPMVEELEAEGKGSGIARDILAENGLLKLALPEEYGGINANFTTVALVIEELAKVDAGISMNVFTSNTVNFFVNMFASEEQKPKFYSILKERVGGAFCLTEPGYGSDAANITMKGVYQDGYYIINGTKTMTSDGPVADSFIVYVRTGPGEKARGISCFFMEKLPGISAGKHLDKLGFRTSATSELFFENVKAPKECLLGGEGKGWNTLVYGGGAMRAFGASSQALGTAEGAMEYAIRYAKERITFGRPIIQHQAIMFMIAEMGIKIEAARSLHYRTLQMIDRGGYSQAEYQLLTSATKCFVCDMAMEVTTDAVQVLGAYGTMNEYPVARRMRDAKVNQIFDGTSQIQKLIVGRTLAEMY
jgi:alkylation response protein AidB-like acyl-CoA dehydrogenase